MRIYLVLVALLGFAAAYVHDLDDEAHLADLSTNGLTFSNSTEEINMKVVSSDGTTGYSWIIDEQACEGIINIKVGYIFVQPEDDLAGLDVGYGEEIFTLTPESKGECTFRAAYAQTESFVSFEDYANQNGKIISIPVRVSDEIFEEACDPAVENCELKAEFGIGKKHERAFKIMGIQAWLRAFTGSHLFVFLPQAITWTRAKNGNVVAAQRFLWITKWWANIAGWISSLGVLFLGMLVIELFYMGPGSGKKLLAPHVLDHKHGLFNIFWSDRPGDVWLEVLGWFTWFVEFACWFMFYWTYKDAKKYAEYLIASGASASEEELNLY